MAKHRPRVADESAPQRVEDQHAPNYRNDSEGWVRGAANGPPNCFNETAESKPGFDHSQAQLRRN
jgi:hypothetical protein